jgi:hypothetical protein
MGMIVDSRAAVIPLDRLPASRDEQSLWIRSIRPVDWYVWNRITLERVKVLRIFKSGSCGAFVTGYQGGWDEFALIGRTKSEDLYLG